MPNFVSNQPPWPKYFELSLVTIFFKLSDQTTFKKIKVTNFNMQKNFNIYFTGIGTSLVLKPYED